MGDMALAVMPNAVLRLAIGFNLGETRAVELLYIVKIGRDEDDGHEQEPSKQNDSDHHKLHRWTARTLECANVIRPFRGDAKALCFLILQLPVKYDWRQKPAPHYGMVPV
jgi:hypothetical protein